MFSELLEEFLEDVAVIRNDSHALKRSNSSGVSSDDDGTHSESSSNDLATSSTHSLYASASLERNKRPPRHSISEGVHFMRRSVSNGSRKSLPFALGGANSDFGTGSSDVGGLTILSENGGSLGSALGIPNLTGPIIDVQLLLRGQKCPSGYQKVMYLDASTNGLGSKHNQQVVDLNRGHAGKSVNLCFKRGNKIGPNEKKPITGIVIFNEDRGFVPPGYEIVGTSISGHFFADLAMGMGQHGRVFLCVCRGEGPPIMDISALHAKSLSMSWNANYDILERTPMGYSAVLNAKNKANSIFLCVARDPSHIDILERHVSNNPVGSSSSSASMKHMVDSSSSTNASVLAPPVWLEHALNDDSIPLLPSCCSSYSTYQDGLNSPSSSRSASSSSSTSNPNSGNNNNNNHSNNNGSTKKLVGTTSGYTNHHNSCTGGWRTSVSRDELCIHTNPDIIELIHPLLKSCYTYNSSCIIIALRYLERILKSEGTTLFNHNKENGFGIGDLIIKAASDCTELGLDIVFAPAMRVLRTAVEVNTFGLNPLSMHFIIKSIVRTTSFFRMLPIEKYTNDDGSRVYVSDDAEERLGSNLSTVSLEDLDFLMRSPTLIFSVFAKRCHPARKTTPPSEEITTASTVESFILNEVLDDLLDRVCEMKRMMNVTDEAAKLLARHVQETPAFACDIYHLTKMLGPHALTKPQANMITLLVWMSQASAMPLTGPLRRGRLFNAELNFKLTTLSLLKDVFQAAHSSNHESFFMEHLFAYQIRRFTFTGILFNASDARRIELVLPILSELWKNWRRHLKIEFAVVIEKVLLFVLQNKMAPTKLRREFLTNMVSWFGMHPGDLVELFLNFENDPVVNSWNSFEGLVETLCQLAEPGNTSVYCAFPDDTTEDTRINDEIQYEALASLVTLLRSLTDMSGTLRLMKSDDRLRAQSVRNEDGFGWAEEVSSSSTLLEDQESTADHTPTTRTRRASTATASDWDGDKESSVRVRHNSRAETSKTFSKAYHLAKTRGVKKAITFLAAASLLDPTPTHVASFLHLYHKELGEKEVGQYLGSNHGNESFMDQVRLEFTRALSFAGKSFEQCLRLFLEEGHFFLPGESQQVERLLDSFAGCFVDENQGEFSKDDKDMIMVLAYSSVMLNTDLHNPAVNKKKKMTEEQFLRQISFIENGNRISKEFGVRLYQSIAKKEIKMADPTSMNQQAASSSSNGGGSGQFDAKSEPYSSSSINMSHSSSSSSSTSSSSSDIVSETKMDDTMSSNSYMTLRGLSKTTAEQLVSRARAEHLFQTRLTMMVGGLYTILASNSMQWRFYHSKVTSESVRVMFEIVWVHFFHVVTRILENPRRFSLDFVSLALDILSHSISISLFLGMETERKAFANLLAKFHYLYTSSNISNGPASSSSSSTTSNGSSGTSNSGNGGGLDTSLGLVQGDHLKDKWYEDVMEASCESDNVIEVINEVHHLIACMKDKIAKRQSYEELLSIQKRFDGAVAIMETGRQFVREGPLSKRSRVNKYRKYQFFLFSDLLIYASQRAITSKYHAHQMLALHTMQVRETDSPKCFEIRHPKKTFIVQASTEEEKREWMRDINREIETLYRIQLATTTVKPYPSTFVTKKTPNNDTNHDDEDDDDVDERRRRQRHSSLGSKYSSDGLGIVSDYDDDYYYDDEDEGEVEMEEEEAEDDNENEHEMGGTAPPPPPPPHNHLSSAQSPTSEQQGDDDSDDGTSKMITMKRKALAASKVNGLSTRKLDWLESLTKEDQVDQSVRNLNQPELHKKFVVGLRFAKPILMSNDTRYVATDEQKLLIYGFFKQSTHGDCNITDPPLSSDWVSYSKYKVWESLQGTPKDLAKKRFLTVLNSIAPGWNEKSSTTTSSA